MQAKPYKRCSRCREERPLSDFHRELRNRDGLGSWCRQCKNASGRASWRRKQRPIQQQRAEDAAARAETIAAGVDPAFGHWLAGFIDGEGCFVIPRQARRNGGATYHCAFRLSLRDDDGAIVHEIHDRLGIGHINAVSHKIRRVNQGGAIAWSLSSKADCLALAAVLGRYPLRARKARDFAIWLEALACWQAGLGAQGEDRCDWTIMEGLRERLRSGRAYKAPH